MQGSAGKWKSHKYSSVKTFGIELGYGQLVDRQEKDKLTWDGRVPGGTRTSRFFVVIQRAHTQHHYRSLHFNFPAASCKPA
mmetsp:Transcript_10365/g.36115  ORF Transcript_10365/g.36115 Transcript_10365/m.36115 type:complete len:81 (+) Transcript_10365:1918-2160(+)